MQELLDNLKELYALNGITLRNPSLAWAEVTPERLVGLLTQLRDAHGFTHLVLMTCVDWLEDGRFQVTYLLHNYTTRQDLGLHVYVGRTASELPSIHTLWEQGRVYQQELHEMFGIYFPGSPGLGEPMILESWDGPPPMRRDFDTRVYSEETYSHRQRTHHEPEQHMKDRLYPED